MSGIFAYAGEGLCKDILLEGIACLEERGNELSGIAIKSGDEMIVFKTKDSPSLLKEKAKGIKNDGGTGIAECSNALRCKPTNSTSVPSANNLYAAALDGYIENFDSLKKWTNSPFPILTDEDLLIASLSVLTSDNKLEMIKRLAPSLQGNPSFAFMPSDEDAIYCRAGEAPLLIGISENGNLLSSEISALTALAKKYYPLENGECAKITKDRVVVYDSRLKRVKKSPLPLPAFDYSKISFSTAETLYNYPFTVREAIKAFVQNGSLNFDALRLTRRSAERIRRVILTGSGASLNAARLAASNFEMLTDIPAAAIPSGELCCSSDILDKGTLLIAVSENGENAQTAACVKKANKYGARAISFCRNESSYLARLSSDVIKISESGFVSSYLALAFFILYVGYKNDIVSDVYLGVTIKVAEMLPGRISAAIKRTPQIERAAQKILSFESIFVTGIGADYSLSFEAAQRLRRISGVSAAALPASELAAEGKETLGGSLVLAIISNRDLMQKPLKYLRRMRTLGAEVVIITTANIEAEIDDFESVISFSESVTLFNPVICISGIYTIAEAVQELLNSENEQQAI